MFLQTYAATRSVAATGDHLVNGGLPQRSRVTRALILRVIATRLTRWNPPAWVLADLVTASQQTDGAALQALLLLHYARQDTLVYDFVQHVIWPRWQTGEVQVVRDDVQAFLDATVDHPEVTAWSYETRTKLAGNLLTTLRDYGLLTGTRTTVKQIVEPVVDVLGRQHLQRLLEEEGISPARMFNHPDWRIWLLAPERVAELVALSPADVRLVHE